MYVVCTPTNIITVQHWTKYLPRKHNEKFRMKLAILAVFFMQSGSTTHWWLLGTTTTKWRWWFSVSCKTPI